MAYLYGLLPLSFPEPRHNAYSPYKWPHAVIRSCDVCIYSHALLISMALRTVWVSGNNPGIYDQTIGKIGTAMGMGCTL